MTGATPAAVPGMPDLAALLRRAQDFATRSGDLQRITGEGEAADGNVRVIVGPSGAIKDVTLTPRAMRLDSQALSEAVLEAARAAAADAGEQVASMTASLLPPGFALPGSPHGIRTDIDSLNAMAAQSTSMLETFEADLRRRQQ